MEWSTLLRQRRELCKLTQTELAVRAGVSLPSIQNMEAGRANPSLKTLEKVFSIVGIRIEFHAEEHPVVAPPAPAASAKKVIDEAEPSQALDLGKVLKDVSGELAELTKGTALERAGKLVKLFEKMTEKKKD